jgi:sugar lactone lactonase YvrE
VRTGLILLLVALLALFVVLAVLAIRLATPVGVPEKSETPAGIEWVRSIYGWGPGELQQLYAPSDVAVATDGTVWITDPQRWQVTGFSPAGAMRSIIHVGPGRMMPQAIAAGADGEVYVADYLNSRIRVFSATSAELRSWDTSLPTEVAVRDGKVVVGMVGGIAVYDEQGTLITFWGGRGPGRDEFDIVRGIAVGPDGTIYASDTQNHRVKAYSQKGELKWISPSASQESSPTRAPVKPIFQLPAGMTFDGAGRLVVADPFAFQLVVLDPKDGHVLGRYGAYGVQDGMFAYPTSVSYDSRRDWFAVADTANDRVQIIRIPGSGSTVARTVGRMTVGPWWVWLLPLLILGMVVAWRVVSRRRARRREVAEDDPVDEGSEADGLPR